MNSISTVEDYIIDKAKALFGNTLSAAEVLPSALNLAVLKQLVASNRTPGVYTTFLGGQGNSRGSLNGRFDVYVITRHVGNHSARRRGDTTTIGAYEILAALIPKLHDATIQGVGSLELKNVRNLFSMQLEQSFKATMYAVTFELPNMPFPNDFDPSVLGDFVIFHAEHSLVDGDDEPDAIDHITLEQ